MNQLEGVNLHEKRGGRFKFRMRLTKSMRESSIEALELSVRSSNSLKRAGLNTVGDVVNAVTSGTQLKEIRNCGAKSVREIMEQLFLYQYNSLPPDKQYDYLIDVVMLNKKDPAA